MNIKDYIAQLSGESPASIQLEALKGGYWNEVYRYRYQQCDWVIKVFNAAADSPLYPVLPDSEAKALELLQSSGCAPTLIRFDRLPDGQQILVYEFVTGIPWSGQQEQDFLAVGQLLAKLHDLKLPLSSFRLLPITAKAICTQAEEILAKLPQSRVMEEVGLEQLNTVLKTLRTIDDSGPTHRVLVHTDCGPGNMIANNQGLCLIDWQCPGIGDPCHDLAVFLSPAMQTLYGRPPLSDTEAELILTGYNNPQVSLRFHNIRIHYHCLFAAYCLYRRETLKESEPENAHSYAKALSVELELISKLKISVKSP